MTRYIAAYDTESPHCYEAVRKIVAVHREFQMPATFFIVGKWLDERRREYRELLSDELFELASHSWSHGMVKDNPFCGPSLRGEALAREILDSKKIVEDVFQRPCVGFRSPCGFDDGLRAASETLALMRQAGYRYVSTQAWGEGFTLPSPFYQPFTYADDGYPDLWELPCHGWHENVLKGATRLHPPFRVAWPIESPELVPLTALKTPEEEAALYRNFLDAAVGRKLHFVSLVWHPWSLNKFDPEMRMLRATFEYVRKLGLPVDTYEGLYRACAAGEIA